MLLGGRHHDEVRIGVLCESHATDGLRLAFLIGIFALNPEYGLVAREWNLQHVLLALLRAGNHVVGLKGHVVGRWPCFHHGQSFAIDIRP